MNRAAWSAVVSAASDVGMPHDPGIRGGRLVILLADLRAVPHLRDQLLLRVEMIPDQRLRRPNPVQQQQLSRRVIPQVTDQLADRGPILLLYMRTVVLVTGPRPGELQTLVRAVPQKVRIDEFT